MNDTPGFTPVEPTPRIPVAPPPTAWAAPAAPTVFTPPPPEPPRRGLGGGAIAALITVGVVVFCGAAAGVVGLATGFAAMVEESSLLPVETRPLVDGDPGSPIAVDPLACADDVCFDASVFRRLTPTSGDLRRIGLTEQWGAFGDYATSTEQSEFINARDWWEEQEVTPEPCFITALERPLALTLSGGSSAPDDPIEILAEYGDESEYSYFAQSARLFGTTTEAAEHMQTFDDLLGECSVYSLTDEYGRHKTRVSPAPAIIVDDSVSALGWVEEWDFGRYYAFDVQRGNVVVRTIVSTDGLVTEEDYRSYVEIVARELAALDTLG